MHDEKRCYKRGMIVLRPNGTSNVVRTDAPLKPPRKDKVKGFGGGVIKGDGGR